MCLRVLEHAGQECSRRVSAKRQQPQRTNHSPFTSRDRASKNLEASNGAVVMNLPTITIQIRDHEYAPWQEVDVKTGYTIDDLGFLHLESSDGHRLKPVHRRDARRRTPAWTRMSMRRRWIPLPVDAALRSR